MITIGVIIGRFQTPFLHEAHVNLIQSVIKKHGKVIILLGCSPRPGTMRDPLDYNTRARMLLSSFPDVIIGYIEDCRSNEVWSQNVDKTIGRLKNPMETPILYGSRDSFIPYYSGSYTTKELDSEVVISATVLRDQALRQVKNTEDFRAGVICGTSLKYPTVFTTVDVAVFNEDKLLLGRKKGEKQFRFIGGFADPKSGSFEEDAAREVSEETTISISNLTYVCSCAIDDWRYRQGPDKIKTVFFYADYQFGCATASDDIEEVKWFDFNTLTELDLIEEHRPLLTKLKEFKK